MNDLDRLVVNAVRAGLRLPLPQLAILMLARRDRNLSVRHFAELLDLSVPNTSRALDALARQGLILRRENPADRRLLRAACTKRGRAYLADIEARAA